MSFLNRLLPKRFRKTGLSIPVVRLHGTIMAGGSQFKQTLNIATVAPMLEKAFAKKDAPVVAISINSPGGSPVQSRLIYQRIRALLDWHPWPRTRPHRWAGRDARCDQAPFRQGCQA